MSNRPPVRALIFDLDGTIADTINAIRDGLNETMKKYNYPERTYEDVRRAIGNGARSLVRLSMPEPDCQNETRVGAVLSSYDLAYSRTYLHTRECYNGIPEVVAQLHERGYRMAVLSNKQDPYVKGLIRQLLPKGEMEVVMGQTELPKKPDPTVPFLIAHQLCVTPFCCAMIGDSEVDIQTAKKAGMLAVGCSWGYRSREVLEEAGADVIVDKPEELLSLFASLNAPKDESLSEINQ
jgi:phosphoglycolate phosphatase